MGSAQESNTTMHACSTDPIQQNFFHCEAFSIPFQERLHSEKSFLAQSTIYIGYNETRVNNREYLKVVDERTLTAIFLFITAA